MGYYLFSILIHSHQRTIILNLSNHFRRQSSIHNHFRNSSSWSISQSINWNHFWYSFIYIPIYIYHYSGFQSTRIHSNSTILYCQRSIHSHYHSHLSFYSYHSHYSNHHHSHHSIKEEETYSTKEVNRRSEICWESYSKSISFCIINHLSFQLFDSIQTITNNDRKDYWWYNSFYPLIISSHYQPLVHSNPSDRYYLMILISFLVPCIFQLDHNIFKSICWSVS